MADILTKEQDLAVNLKRHISVKANAGSGKTKVLVDRYIRILLESYTNTEAPKTTPYEIVAMTFTRKAAGDMLKKIVEKIEELQAETPPSDPKTLTAYGKIRNDLNAARISTIHSFASSLLRDFAVEANVNPNFVEISEANIHRIKNEAFEYEITKIYQESESDLNKALISFINRYSIKTLEEYVNNLIYSKEYLAELNKSELYKTTTDELIEKYTSIYFDYINYTLEQILYFTNLAFNCTPENSNPVYQAKSSNFKNLYIKYQFNKSITLNDLSSYIKELALIYSGKPGVKGNTGLPNYFNSFRCNSMDFDYAGVPKILEKYTFDADEIINSTKIQIEDAKFLLEFANRVLKKTDDEKQKSAFLDFDDILIKTDELLSNPEVANKISSKIKFIMVDEFQDTNQTQYSILKKLVPGLFDEQFSYPTSPEVFIVGDEKQSIYGFRGADVRIIKEATGFIEKHQQIREEDYMLRRSFKNASSQELSGNIELNASFRMKPALALFTNAVFLKLMESLSDEENKNTTYEKYRAVYSPIVSGKPTEKNEEPFGNLLEKNNGLIDIPNSIDMGSVEFLISENDYKFETQIIADSIIDLLKSGKYNAKDICILSRDKKHLRDLTTELSNREIPFFLHAASGFYQTVEVRDVLSILSFLSDTKNDFELVMALKSPFFGLHDSDLLILTNTELENPNSTLWEKLQAYSTIPEIDSETIIRFENATNLINYLLRISYRMSIPKLIRTLLKESGWMSKITPFKDKDQRIANIYKLIDSAREFEKQGFLSIYDFVKELETLEEISKEGEAGINSENSINIMTIHSAKGLEFPIVYLYDANRDLLKKLSNTTFFKDTEIGLSFKNAKLIDNRFYTNVDNIPVLLAKNKNKEISIYEEVRLLYVAMTRAIDKLFISASIVEFDKKTDDAKYNLEKTSFIQMIINSLPNFPEAQELTQSSFNLTHSELQFLESNEIKVVKNVTMPITYKLLTNKNIAENTLKVIDEVDNIKHYYSNTNLDNVMGHERDIFFSASKLSTFKKDKKRFWLEYILEMDDFLLKKSLNKFNTAEAKSLLGQETGTAIHGVFEKMNRWYDFENGLINENEFDTVLNDALSKVDAVGNEKITLRIKNEVDNVMKTQLIQNKEFDFSTMKNEFALRYAFGNDFLSGVIDLLIKDIDGNYEIWDFKSDYLTTDNIKNKAEDYEEQIKLYVYLIYLLNDKPKLVKARLLFTRLAFPNAKHEEWTYKFIWSAQAMEEYKIELEERINIIYQEYSL